MLLLKEDSSNRRTANHVRRGPGCCATAGEDRVVPPRREEDHVTLEGGGANWTDRVSRGSDHVKLGATLREDLVMKDAN